MSADNFFLVRKDGTVEERRMSYPDQPGPVIHTGENQDEAADWAEKEEDRRNAYGSIVEYGIEVE